jgi:hypothetical protein
MLIPHWVTQLTILPKITKSSDMMSLTTLITKAAGGRQVGGATSAETKDEIRGGRITAPDADSVVR